MRMQIGITGASGLIGTALSRRLRASGHTVVPFVRGTPDPGQIVWDPAAGSLDPADLVALDAVVHLAGAGIADGRWTDEYKQVLLRSRVAGTTLLAETLASLDGEGPTRLLSASAIGFYGERGDEVLDETAAGGDGFLAEICRSWEDGTEPAAAAGIGVAHLRTGIVLSPAGGALKKMLPLFKIGAGGRFGSGGQWMSWISIDDEIGAIEHLLASDDTGPVNLTAPGPVTNREFATTLGRVLRRPSIVPVPRFGPRLVLGRELADALLFDGQRVLPRVLIDGGFEFAHPDLESALRAVLDRR
jgi:uncharacterized protein (TIGR01777 family)